MSQINTNYHELTTNFFIRFAKSQDWAARLPVVTLKLGKSLVDNIKLDTRILVDFVLICKNIFNITF